MSKFKKETLKAFVDAMEVEDAFYPGKVLLGRLVRNFVTDSVFQQGYYEVAKIPKRIRDLLDENGYYERVYEDYTYTVHAYGRDPKNPQYYYGTKVVTEGYYG